MKSPTRRKVFNSFYGERLHALQRAFAIVGREASTPVFAHVHPHSHATARLTHYFLTSHFGGRGAMTPTNEEIVCGAYLHDIGKYFIHESVLLKPGALDEDEMAVMSLHPVYGAAVVSRFDEATEAIRRAVLYHHEHWDGTGYPEGLFGPLIPFEARVVSVVDAYTSLRSRRSYKPTLSKEGAVKVLTEMAGRELDPYLVKVFVLWLTRMSHGGWAASPLRHCSSAHGSRR